MKSRTREPRSKPPATGGVPVDDTARQAIIDRANRMLSQSKTLRKMSGQLLQESQNLRRLAVTPKTKKTK